MNVFILYDFVVPSVGRSLHLSLIDSASCFYKCSVITSLCYYNELLLVKSNFHLANRFVCPWIVSQRIADQKTLLSLRAQQGHTDVSR